MRKILLAFLLVAFTITGTAFSFGNFFEVKEQKAAYVDLSGTITSSSGQTGALTSTGITPEQVRNLNERVDEGPYEAVVYEINSGGGTVVASKDVMREIDSVEITTVCRFRDVAASGAYLIALGCDEVVADPASMTGSIGVRSSYLEFSEAMERYGIEYVNITSGEFKGTGSPYENASQEDIDALQEQASKIHEQFLETIADRRNMTREDVDQAGDGSIILGEEAYEAGLVDHLGGRTVAEQVAEERTGVELEFESVTQTESLDLFSLLTMEMSSFLGNSINSDSLLVAEM